MRASNILWLPALSLLAALSLTACQSTGTAYRAAPAPTQTADRGDLPRFEPDEAYISYVERQAASRGIAVHWVNRPHKRQPVDSKANDAD